MANLGSELEQSSSTKRWAWRIVPGMLAAVAALALPLTLYAHRSILASCLMVVVVAGTLLSEHVAPPRPHHRCQPR